MYGIAVKERIFPNATENGLRVAKVVEMRRVHHWCDSIPGAESHRHPMDMHRICGHHEVIVSTWKVDWKDGLGLRMRRITPPRARRSGRATG